MQVKARDRQTDKGDIGADIIPIQADSIRLQADGVRLQADDVRLQAGDADMDANQACKAANIVDGLANAEDKAEKPPFNVVHDVCKTGNFGERAENERIQWKSVKSR